MARDGLPTGLPFASAGEPRVHMPAQAASPAAPSGLADYALVAPHGQDGPNGQDDLGTSAAQGGFGDASGAPVLRILYNASTKGALHPCPS